ncbi:multidrug MFS transporter [Burkholderia contaminans]|uniref:Multidrug MFS transporter n=2 Tax=Burkholderiaceae TaxID=119060 RepID=A0A6P2YE70_9BURK|nr:multidrug MFS transporter [Burkholderia contaminans]
MPIDILPPAPARRRFMGAATAAMAGSLSRLACAEAETAQPVAGIARSAGGAGAAVRPLRVHATDAQLADLRRRIDATRWPERETVADASQGVPQALSEALRASFHALR